MARLVFPAPVLPGKQASSVADAMRNRLPEYEESRRQKGIVVERAYEMATPMGSFAIGYIETEGTSTQDAMMAMGVSQLPIDVAFRAALLDVHGMDMSQPPPGPPPEVLGDWRDPDVKDRRRGLAFLAPVMPGATDFGRSFAHQAWHERVDEHTASRRALGVTQETVCLNATPMGDIICVYLEGDDPVEGNRRFAESRSEYDTWFKQQCRSIFPPEIDFDEPLPPIGTIWDFTRDRVVA